MAKNNRQASTLEKTFNYDNEEKREGNKPVAEHPLPEAEVDDKSVEQLNNISSSGSYSAQGSVENSKPENGNKNLENDTTSSPTQDLDEKSRSIEEKDTLEGTESSKKLKSQTIVVRKFLVLILLPKKGMLAILRMNSSIQ